MSKFNAGDTVRLTGADWHRHGLEGAVSKVIGVDEASGLAYINRAPGGTSTRWYIHEDGGNMEKAWGAALVVAASETLQPWEFGLGRVGNYAIYSVYSKPGDIDQVIRIVDLETSNAVRVRRYPFETNGPGPSPKRAAFCAAAKVYFDATPRLSPSASAQVGEVWDVRRSGSQIAERHMVITGQLGVSFVDSAGTTFLVTDESIEYARQLEVR